MNAENIAVVICAAGKSSRMGGGKKEYLPLVRNEKLGIRNERDVTVLGAAVRAFASVGSVGTIAVAIPPDDEENARNAVSADLLNSLRPKIIFVDGGDTRQASVFNALSALEEYNPCYVLIHDGARPRVSVPLIEKIIDAAKKHGAAIPVLEFTDTPKEHDGVFIMRHLRKANTGAAQTPQGFKFAEILEAHKKAAGLQDEEFTDDAEIWGRFCGQVAVIPGEAENRKITFMEDLFGHG